MTHKHLLAAAALVAGFFFALPASAYDDGHSVEVYVGVPPLVTAVQHDHHDASCGCSADYAYGPTYASQYDHAAPQHVAPHGRHHVRPSHASARYDPHDSPRVEHDNSRGRSGKHQGDRRANGRERHR